MSTGTFRRLTQHAGLDADPAWSPDGSRIAWTSARGGGFSIWVMRRDGTGVRRLTAGPADAHPAWSPDGRTVAFVRAATRSLELVGADGTGLRRIGGERAFDVSAAPTWAPDGRRLVIPGADGALYRVAADGRSLRRLTPRRPTMIAWRPAWSPRGGQIAFLDLAGGALEVVEAATARVHVLARRTDALSTPAWSPDGRFLAFADAGGHLRDDLERRPRTARAHPRDLDRRESGVASLSARTTNPATGSPASSRSSAGTISGRRFASASTRSRYCTRMAVAPVRADGVPRVGPGAGQFLDGEDEPSAGTQRVRGSRNDLLERSEIDERVCRHDHVERPGGVAQVGGQLTFDQLVVDIPRPGLSEHALRTGRLPPVGAHTARRAVRTARCRSRHRARRGSSTPRHPIPPASPRPAPARGTTAWRAWNRSWRRSCRRSVSMNASDARGGTSRPEQAASMCRAIGIVRLLFQPFLEDLDRLVDLAERAVRQRQQPPRFGILRPERDDLGEADGRFVRPLLAVQQDAEVVVGVRVLGIDADGGSIRRFGFDRLALALAGPHRDCCGRWRDPDRVRSRADTRRSLRPARVDPAGRSPDCCASPPARARARGSSRSARLPARSAPADGRALPRSATRRHGRARPRGCCGRSPPQPPTARSAAARWRSISPRPG